MTVKPDITVYSTQDLLAWHEQGTLRLSPKFQRRAVWKSAARSYFIDTILMGFPVPPIHIRNVRESGRSVREVVDGQQRLRAIFDFLAGKFRISPSSGADWAGKTFAALDVDDQNRFQDYMLQVYQYQSVSDAQILEIFARMNTYAVKLNAQELRNGKYFGVFKQTVYSLALDHLQFWRGSRVFTEAAITRMNEAELVSELLVLQLDGLQDKKSSIDSFYKNLDEQWPSQALQWSVRKAVKPRSWLTRSEAVSRLRHTMDAISTSVGDLLPESEFRRVPLFYTLYAAVYHRLYGLPGYEAKSPSTELTDGATLRLRSALEEMSDLLSDKPQPDDLHGWQRDFVLATARQTDNIAPRLERLNIVWRRAELSKR